MNRNSSPDVGRSLSGASRFRGWSIHPSLYPEIGRAAIWTMYLTVFLDFCQMSCVFPFIFDLVRSFGGSDAVVSDRCAMLSSTKAAVEAVANTVLGRISDRFGRRTVMIIATFGNMCASILMGRSRQFSDAVMARFLNGMSGSTPVVANTFLADVVPPDQRAEYMTRITIMVGLGLSIGPFIGRLLYARGGIALACGGAATISFVNFARVAFFMKESSKPLSPLTPSGKDSQRKNQSDSLPRIVWILFFANMFNSPLSVLFDTFSPIYVTRTFFDGDAVAGARLASRCVACTGICLLVVPLFVYKPVSQRFGFRTTIIAGCTLMVFGLLVQAFSFSPEQFLAGSLLFSVGFQLLGPAKPVLITRVVPQNAFGRAFGLYMSFGQVSRILCPLAFAKVFDFKPNLIYVGMAGMVICLCSILLTVAAMTSPQAGSLSPSAADEHPPEERRHMSFASDDAKQFGNDFLQLTPKKRRSVASFDHSNSVEMRMSTGEEEEFPRFVTY